MTSLPARLLAAASLFVWGGVMACFFFSNRIASYLHPAFHWAVLASGLVLLGLAVGSVVFPERGAIGCIVKEQPLWRLSLAFLILTVPLVAATFVSPSAFGASAVRNRGIVDSLEQIPAYSPPVEPPLPRADGSIGESVAVDPSAYLPKNAAGQIQAETVDLLYASAEPTMREDFENKEVEVIGQFMPARTGNPNGDRFSLVRMFVMCCAADARPIGVTIRGKADFPEMTWLKIIGKATFPIEAGRRTPLVVADSVEEIDPPDESFIY